MTRRIVSLELVFDDDTDAAVRGEWERLSAADLPSQADHTGASNRPHTTLLVRPGPEPADDAPPAVMIDDRDAGPLAAMLPMPVVLGAPVLFGRGERRVLARLVVPSAPLLQLHAAVHAAAGPGDDVDHTVPGAWTPHVTLARRVPLERMGEALAALADDGGGEDLDARVVGIRRWDAAAREISTVVGRGTLETC